MNHLMRILGLVALLSGVLLAGCNSEEPYKEASEVPSKMEAAPEGGGKTIDASDTKGKG